VIRSQQPLVNPRLDLRTVRGQAPKPEIAALLDDIRPHSFMCVPLVARGRGFGAISFTTTGENGREFTSDDVEIAMELARRASGAIDNAVIYQRSVALRMEAEAASHAKSDFLAKMSHEIRTPINAMMGYAELLQMGISGPVTEQQAKQLGRIRASGDHLTALVNEILDLAKIEAGQMGVEPSIASAHDAADAALTLIRPQANRKGVEVAPLADDDGVVEYLGDPQRVQQILTNLLANAVKFTAPGGRVTVHCSRTRRAGMDGEWVCIRVDDTGLGIQPEDIDRIFHPFVQVDSGYTRSHGGTGLGLTISRSLAHLMGGDITVESNPGAGSTFILWLPCPNRALEVG
jgi:signal transduction histidine kinase